MPTIRLLYLQIEKGGERCTVLKTSNIQNFFKPQISASSCARRPTIETAEVRKTNEMATYDAICIA